MGRRCYVYPPPGGGQTANIPLGTMTLTPQPPTLSISGGAGVTFYPVPGVSIFPSNQMIEGQTYQLTVPAGGLGNRANALPLFYWPMDLANGLNTHPTLSRTARTLTDNGNGTAVTASNPYPNSTGSCRYLVTSTSGSTSTAFGNSPHIPITGGAGYQIYAQIKHYWGFPTAPNNDKFFRLWSQAGGVGNTPDVYWAYGAGGNYLLAAENNDNAVSRPLGSHFLGLPLTTQAWNSREMWWQENTLNSSDGICNFALNGVFGYVNSTRYGVCNANNSSGANPTGAGPMTQLYLDQYSAFPGPDGSSQFSYFGPIYIDDSYLQLLLTDEGANYQTTVAVGGVTCNREVQIQTGRTDTAVQFVFRKGMFSSLTTQNLIATTGYMQGMNLGSFAASFDYYISPTGSNSNSGASTSAPWAITAINTKQATYAGKRVGLMPGTYDVSSLMNTSFHTPVLNINGGPNSSTKTYIASCDASGNYSKWTATLDAKGASGIFGGGNSNISSIIGQGHETNLGANWGNWTIDGLRIVGFSLWGIHIGNYDGVGGAVPNATIQNCEITGGSGQTTSVASGVNLAPIVNYTATNATVTNNYIHDNLGWTDQSHFSALYMWGLGAGGQVGFTFTYNTVVNSGNVHSKEAKQYNATVAYNFIDMTLKTPSGGPSQNASGIFGFGSDGGSGTLSSFHHNIVLGYGAYINLDNDTGQNYWDTPVEVYNNTYISVGTNTSGAAGSTMYENTAGSHNGKFYNQLYADNAAGGYGYVIAPSDFFNVLNFNQYGTGNKWSTVSAGGQNSGTAVTRSSLAAWQTATGGDANSTTAASVSFTNSGARALQYKITAGAPFGSGHVGGVIGGAAVNKGAWDGIVTQIGSYTNGIPD